MVKFKTSRAASFLAVAAVYALAAVVGIAVYGLVGGGVWLRLLAADVAATVVVFVFSVVFGNASVYDPYWSVQPIVIVCAFAFGKALNPLALLVTAAVLLWGIRLTANWAYTFKGLCAQDWRYTMLKQKMGKLYPLVNFTGIHLVPTLIVFGCVYPAVTVIQAGQSVGTAGINTLGLLGVALSVFAFTMQGVADVQMHGYRLRKQRGETGEPFIRTGMWRYARHPNYLGEILMWWGVAISAVSVQPHSWYLLLGALANTCLFVTVSIPMADRRQACKAGYEEYRRSTRALLPVAKPEPMRKVS